MRIPRSVQVYAPPILLSALLLYGLHHLWYRAFGMWAAGIRPLFVSAKRAAEMSPDALGPWFGLEFLVLAAALLPLFRYGGERLRRALPALMAAALVISQIVFAALAWKDFAGQIPWSVDHPSFLFRLHEVRATFPRLGGYNPWWNGGTEHFISVTSGTHGYAALVAPLLALFEPHVFHAPVLFFWTWIGFPWLGALCVRAAGARWTSALAAAAMLECYCRAQFLFAWHYGILGGLVTAGLATPLAALGYRLVVQRRGGWGTAVALGVVAWLSCLWTPGYATCAGLALGALATAGRWCTRRSLPRVLAAALLALALLAPWAWVTLGPAHGIVDFASGGKDALPFFRTLRHGLLLVVYRLLEWHPALVAFGVVGLALGGPRRLRRWVGPALLLLLGVLVYSKWNDRSQCYRAIFQGAALAAFPAGVLCGRLLSRPFPASASGLRAWAPAAARAATLAALLLGLRVSGVHALNNGAGLPYYEADERVMSLVDWIRENVPEEGRLAFAGETSNFVGGGTVAYLPILTGREMMSDDYYTFPPGLTSRNYPPAPYRRSVDAFLSFSRLYGITHWAVVDRSPRKLGFSRGTPGCGGRPGAFDERGTFPLRGGKVTIFAVHDPGPVSRLLVGEGAVESRENRILVRPADPAADTLVLRYNWREGLVCKTPGATIEPYPADENLLFVAVHPNGAPEVEIGYRAGFRPLAPNFDGRYHH